MKKKSLSENLIYQRKLKGHTQESLSDKTNVGVRTIQRIEKRRGTTSSTNHKIVS